MKHLAISIVLLLGSLSYAGDTVLYSFHGAPDGQLPLAGLVSDSAGNLYGTTIKGGTGPCTSSTGNGCGVIFKLSPSGNGWSETVLYSFRDKNDGEYPFAGLAIDASGNLYGTTSSSGPCPPACGNVLEFSASGVFTVVHRFGGGLDGGIPMSGPAPRFVRNYLRNDISYKFDELRHGLSVVKLFRKVETHHFVQVYRRSGWRRPEWDSSGRARWKPIWSGSPGWSRHGSDLSSLQN